MKKLEKYYIWAILAAAAAVRLWAAIDLDHMSHPWDINTFRAWADMLASDGLAAFYGSPAFTDYPPGYMYILSLLGHIRQALGLEFASVAHNFLLKTPAMLFDLATVAFIYKIAIKFNHGKYNFAAAIALIYALNPAIILNSAVWGQVESIHTFLLAVSIYLIGQRKMLPAVLLFAVSIMVKPQSFMFSPIYLFMFYKYIFGENHGKFNPQNFGRLALYGLACFALIAALSLPFIDFGNLPANFTDIPIVAQYIDTFTTYPLITNNAYNIYSLFGLNRQSLYFVDFFGISFNVIGTAWLAAITLLAFFLLWKKNKTEDIFLVAALIVIGTFLLSVRMHERYNFPAMLFLLLSYASIRDKRLLYVYLLYSAAHFLNNIDVLLMTLANFNEPQIVYSAVIFALPIVVLSAYAIYMAITIFMGRPKIALPALPAKYKNIVVCGAITVFYAIFAFTNLGNTQSPQSRFSAAEGEQVVVDFGDVHVVGRTQYMLGARHGQPFLLEFSVDGHTWGDAAHFPLSETFSTFMWYYGDIPHVSARFARITPMAGDFLMQEMGFRDWDMRLLPVNVISATGHELFDEQALVPLQPIDYMHSAYFDEIYHPRTAYEFIHSMHVFEWTHPPLGKVIISWGIQIFGMTPFGWRFAGAFFGVLMLPLIYAFALRIFGKAGRGLAPADATLWAAFATFIFAFDFMHYAQTRLATIDTYVVIFIIGMYYCMYQYTQLNFYRDKLSRTLLPLLFSGIFTGLAVASKWQGVYAILGIAAIFFWTLWQRYSEYKKSRRKNVDFWRKARITCAACVGFFIVIPLIIYILSYIPFWNTGSLYPDRGFLAAIWQNQLDMFNYHANLDETHAFASNWLQWIINYRPIWYFSNYIGGGVAQGISSFGNPLLWWGGIPAFFYCAYAWAARRDKTAAFLVIAYLSQILPWVFVPRLAWIYHYFPNVPFLALMLAYTFRHARIFGSPAAAAIFKKRQTTAAVFAIVCFALFILFYPVLTGTPIHSEFVSIYLRWFPQWVLLV